MGRCDPKEKEVVLKYFIEKLDYKKSLLIKLLVFERKENYLGLFFIIRPDRRKT